MSDQVVDVIVVGSGGAALTAALGASARGLAVIVLERTSQFGGTTATSSGIVWVPCNPTMAENGIDDTPDEAFEYLAAVAGDRIDLAGARSFVDNAGAMQQFLAAHDVVLDGTGIADYFPDLPGAKARRSMIARPLPAEQVPALTGVIRSAAYDLGYSGLQSGTWVGGAALIAGLMRACRAQGVELRADTRVTDLVIEDGAVVGVRCELGSADSLLRSRLGVILACGGFERDPQLMAQYHGDRVEAAWSAPKNDGDGFRMALAAGAVLANMDQVWWYNLMRVTDEIKEGQPVYRDSSPARNYPGSILVDADGKRFANEAQSYHDLGKIVGEQARRPVWLICDEAFVQEYGAKAFGTTEPSEPWFRSADSIGELATMIGVDPVSLSATVVRWNASVDAGVDDHFGRGESALDRNWGDPARDGAAKTLGRIDKGPFVATRMYSATSGTNGGPRTDPEGRVLSETGSYIPGLFAAGNTTASILGAANPAAGGTLGPMLTLAWRAAQAIGNEPDS